MCIFRDATKPKRSRAGEPLAPAQGGAEGGRTAAQEVVNSSEIYIRSAVS